MKINDQYHDKFREWIRDLKTVEYDKESIRNMIKKDMLYTDIGRIYSPLTLVVSSAGFFSGAFVGYELGKFVHPVASAIGLFTGLILGASIPFLPHYFLDRHQLKLEKIKRTAENQRYALEH